VNPTESMQFYYIIDGAIVGTAEITPKLFTNATVVTY
jgi:hypothetical protein